MANSRALIYPDPLIDDNLVSTADWSTNLSGSTTDFIAYSFSGGSNTRVQDTGPFGESVYVWNADASGGTGARTGFNYSGVPAVAKLVNLTNTYRLSMWVRKKVEITSSANSCYIGMTAYDSTNSTSLSMASVSTKATTTNVWQLTTVARTTLTVEDWYLYIAYIRPLDYAGTTNHENSGLWTTTGTKSLNVTDYQFYDANTYKITLRLSFPYNETGNGVAQYAYPRIDLVDGTEPSFQQLLTGNANLKPLHLDPRSDINLNLVSTSDWSTDLSGSTTDFTEFKRTTTSSNTRELAIDPFGNNKYLWKTDKGTTTSGNWGAGMEGPWIAIDKTKTYRMSCWVKRVKAATNDSNFYFGLRASDTVTLMNVKQVTTGASSVNRYFAAQYTNGMDVVFPTGEWRFLSYLVRPYGYAGTTNDSNSGIWKPDGTLLGISVGDQIFDNASITHLLFRIYAPYEQDYTINSNWYIAYPRIDLVDGTEPTFHELLTGRKPIALANQSDVPTSGDFKMIISSGISSGSDVTRLQFTVNANTTATMSGNGYFTSSDDSQNLGQSIALNSGSLQTIYLHLSDGATCDFTVVGGISKILTIGGYLRSGSGSSCRIEELDLGLNMPTNATSIDLSGDIITELRGNVSTFPTGLKTLYLGNSVSTCTVSFDLADLPSSLVNLSVYNNPTDGRSVHGDISNVSNVTDVNLSECGPVSYTSGSSWDGELLYPIKIKPRAGSSLTVTEVNNLLTDLYNSRSVGYAYPQNALIDLRGGNPAPTGTGVTAYNNLLALGIPVYTNLTEVTNTYTTAGSTSLVIPANTARLVVECWGAGGVGGSASSESKWGGGGGGGYSKSIVTAPTAETLTVVVGTGGSSGTKTSYVQRPSTAFYALAFAGSNAGTSSTGAAGASTSGATGNVAMYPGGKGGDASSFVSGGGGGGANTTSAGANASGSTPGSAGDGGNGGAGRSSAGAGTSGSQPGGGGGGGFGAYNAGGNGGNGKVVVTYQYSA